MKNILFVHQNFPAQFKHLAPYLVTRGYSVAALTLTASVPEWCKGVRVYRYTLKRHSSNRIHPWVGDYEAKVIRGEAAFHCAAKMKADGYVPDLIIAHPGWGEALFLKDVWPSAKLALYGEIFYQPEGNSNGFDPEFPQLGGDQACRLRLKNASNLLSLEQADAILAPTQWQAETFPDFVTDKITVVHDGIRTDLIKPDPKAALMVQDGIQFDAQDEIITFVNRNLEPYRGYHVFMRTLPLLLKRRKRAKVLIVGGDGYSYGAAPPAGQSWKQIFIDEVRPLISDEDWERVHFLDNLAYADFIHFLQISTVHVYLTYPFIVGWSLLEAMSAECAIVASRVDPVTEILEHEKDALLVDFFSVLDLSGEICRLLDDETLRTQLGKAARQKIMSKYDLETISLPSQHRWIETLLTA